ncbi:aminotransferase class I/II-fold pyridoxal phosphate-dependent enzyme [Leptolyngbya sp. 15MV]|nr:aminotransferase class I/II-fold pyridoxal phosphate-dependent enzyme [Leptolyngbya sp. 15MV]
MTKLPVTAASATTVALDGREVLAFAGCNYLGLSFHPAVHAALGAGLARYGLSTSASRETTGNTAAHDRLERDVVIHLGTADAVVVPDGYTANLALAEALARGPWRCGAAVIDRRSHRSLRAAIEVAGLRTIEYAHRDADAALAAVRAAQAEAPGRGVAIFTDGVFTSDGALAPLAELLSGLPARGATLVVDDCHGFCTIGRGGRGALSHLGLPSDDPRVAVTTTLAKGLGCHGGAIAGSQELCAAVRRFGNAYVGTTPVSPAIACAASAALLGEGVLAPLIEYPGGPAACYFRLSVSSEHTPEQIDTVLAALGSRVRQPCAA